MKRSKIWSKSILIALVLLLSVAKNGTPSPNPRPAKNSNEHAALGNQQTSQQPASISNANFSHTPNATLTYDENKDRGGDASTVVIAISAIVSVFVTGLIALFNWQLVAVTRDMRRA